MSFREYLAEQQQLIDRELERLVPPESAPPETIHRAMRYSLFAGGKRVRPVLCMEAARAISDAPRGIETAACSLEFIHTYSLIHDDLPALDNDDYRRGKLLTIAFETLATMDSVTDDRKTRMIAELATAAGTVGGMIGGQVADIEGEGKPPDAQLLATIHRAKTGALLRASVRMGAIYAGAGQQQLDAMSRYGEHVGLAFQIVDDILDVEQSSESLGKTAGKDAQQQKITFPAVYGLDESRRMAESERLSAHQALDMFGDRAGRLRDLADLIVQRKS
jgi:geranylgeranyl diphosphate synthase type II